MGHQREGIGTIMYFVLRKYQENVQNVESAEADDTDEKTKVKEAKTKEQKSDERKRYRKGCIYTG